MSDGPLGQLKVRKCLSSPPVGAVIISLGRGCWYRSSAPGGSVHLCTVSPEA